jgi:hypothetical protein
MGAVSTRVGKKFECCGCGRSVTVTNDLHAHSPLDMLFLRQHGRWHDTRYYASSRVSTIIGFCSDKCFSKKLVHQEAGEIGVSEIAEQLNNDIRCRLIEIVGVDSDISQLVMIPSETLKILFSNITQAPQSLPLDSSVIAKTIGSGPNKIGNFFYRRLPHQFGGHKIGVCSLILDDGGERNVAITSVVFFVVDPIEFSEHPSLELDDSDTSLSLDIYDELMVI